LDTVIKFGPHSENSSPFLVSHGGYGPDSAWIMDINCVAFT